MTEELAGQVSLFDRDIWSGRMSPEHSVQTAEKTFEPSWKCVRVSPSQALLFLDLRTASGRAQESSAVILGLSHGESMTLNIGESPNEEKESRLSQILEVTAPEKYCLSARACQGILRRAATRGKQLPEMLRIALERQASSSTTRGGERIDISVNHTGTLRANDHNHPPVTMTPKTLKIRCGCEGGGKGALIQENLSATLSCRNDQTLFEPCAWNGEQTSPTLTRNNAGGNQRMPDKENFNCVLQPYGISSYESNAMLSSNPHSGIYEAETARTLDLNGGNPACNQGGIAVVFDAHHNTVTQDSPTLLSRKAGGWALWTTPTVCIEGNGSRESHKGPGFKESDTMYTLNTTEQHAVAYEEKVYDMTHACDVIRESEVCPNLNSRMGTGGNQIPLILGEKK